MDILGFSLKKLFLWQSGMTSTFHTSQGCESFLLLPGTMKPSLLSIQKVVSELQLLKEHSLVLIIYGRLAVKGAMYEGK